MAEPIIFEANLAAKKILENYLTQYLDGNDLSPLMGKGESVIQILDEPGKHRGDVAWVPLLDALDVESFKLGSDQLSGTGEPLRFYEDKIVIDEVRKATALESVRMTAQRTPLHVFEALSPQLMEVFQRRLRNDIVDSAAYPRTNAANTSPVTQRALFGGNAYNDNIQTALAALDPTAADYRDKLSVKHIIRCRDRAVTGGATPATAERRIRPTKILMRNGFKSEFFILLAETRACRMLTEDPEWGKYFYARGVIENANQPSLIDGARYKGMIENIMIYEVPALSRIGYAAAGAGPSDVAHSLFCGAQAFATCFAGNPMFTVEERDHKRIYELGKTEMRGVKMLKFKATQSTNADKTVENGIIHSFTALAASV
jgi:hypothetical protein